MEVSCDPLGFPIIRIDDRNLWITFFPITRVQFEHFLCDPATPAEYSGDWYEQNVPSPMVNGQLRIGVHAYKQENYYDCFLRNLDPDTGVKQFADWYANRFSVEKEVIASRLPRNEEWVSCFRRVDGHPPLAEERFDSLKLSWRARSIVRRLWSLSPEWRNLAEQMFFFNGVLEWMADNRKFGYRGNLHPTLSNNKAAHGDFAGGAPSTVENPAGRITHGFRLVFEFPRSIQLDSRQI